VGHLTPNERPSSRSSQKSDAAASDNFSGRTPNGPIVEPASIRAQLRKPTTARSKLAPVAFTLPNGLRVIVQPKTDRPTVYIGGTIASSPGFVPQGKEGITRLASSLANFGTEHYDFTQLRKATDDIGASVELGQRFSAHGFAVDFERLLSLLADGEEHPAFPDRWLTLQRSQIANSLATEETISGEMVDRAYLQRLLLPDDPALRYPSQLSVSSITREDLLAYTSRYWRPDLTTIAIVGDVTPQRARAAVQAAFGSWSNAGETPSVAQPALPPPHTGHAYIQTAANQVFIQLGQRAVARTSRDFDTFNVLTEMLGGAGYFESRLWQELRQKRGLVYGVNTEVKSDKDRGDLEIQLNAAPENVASAITIVRDELERLRTQPVSASELAEAKVRLVSQALLDEASAGGQRDELLAIAQNHLPLDYYGTLSQRYAGITPADVQRVAKEYLQPDRLIEVFAGPEGPWSNHAL
jgi:zinc protease